MYKVTYIYTNGQRASEAKVHEFREYKTLNDVSKGINETLRDYNNRRDFYGLQIEEIG